MEAIFLLFHLKYALQTTKTGRDGILLFCKVLLTTIGLFIDCHINVGWPGRVHDARVFSNSTLYSRGQSKVLLPNSTARICGKDIPLVLLGDPAYPLLPWVMKAYPNTGHLTQQKKCFNYNLSKTRVTIEHSYGRLKGRWRCLLQRLDVDINDVPTIVTTCCVLHNM